MHEGPLVNKDESLTVRRSICKLSDSCENLVLV
jgi:hypothetical protein